MTRCEHCPKTWTDAKVVVLSRHCSTACMALQAWRRSPGSRESTIASLRRGMEAAVKAAAQGG